MVFTWGCSDQSTHLNQRLVFADHKMTTPTVYPKMFLSDQDSLTVWKHLASGDRRLDLMLRDYRNAGRNDFGVIRTI
jgi:hypothetical protein